MYENLRGYLIMIKGLQSKVYQSGVVLYTRSSYMRVFTVILSMLCVTICTFYFLQELCYGIEEYNCHSSTKSYLFNPPFHHCIIDLSLSLPLSLCVFRWDWFVAVWEERRRARGEQETQDRIHAAVWWGKMLYERKINLIIIIRRRIRVRSY